MGNFSNYWDLHTLFTKLKNKLKSISDKIDDSVSLKIATGNPITLTDAANANAEKLLMTIEPIQDLHGYSKPWPAGGGKNLLPMTVDGINAANTSGTWNGNVYTLNGVTFTIQTDSDGNVIGIKVTGTASGDSPSFYLCRNISLANGNYIFNGCPANGSVPTYCMIAEWSGGDVKDLGNGISLSVSGNTINVRIRIQQNYAITSDGITFYPMLRLSTETDATFAPYTNICPISGLTSGEVTRVGKNVLNLGVYPTTWASSGVIHTIDAEAGTISFHRNEASWSNHYYSSTEKYVLKAGSYILSATFPDGISGVRIGIDNGNVFLQATGTSSFTLDEDKEINLYLFYASTQSEDVTISDIMIRSASFTASTFGKTVYGGSVDFKTGEVTVTHGMVDMGDLTFNINTGSGLFYVMMGSIGAKQTEDSIRVLKSSIYTNGGIRSFSLLTDYMIASNSARYFYIKDPRTNSTAELTTLVTGQTLVYELATPVTLTLTPAELELLKGNNTITANGAEINIKYYPDNAIGTLAGRVDDKADKEDVAVPKYDATNRREYFEGGSAFSGNIDSVPTAGSNNAVASGGTKTYVDNLTSFLNFTHFVQIPFTTSVLDSIKAAFENNTIPVDLNGVTIGAVVAGAGGVRVVFIAQNQSGSTTQTRYSAIYFGAYVAPRVCQKQDGTAWTDAAL